MMGGLTFHPSASGLTFTPSGAEVAGNGETRGRKLGDTSSAVRDRALDCASLRSAQSVVDMAQQACNCSDGCADSLQLAWSRDRN